MKAKVLTSKQGDNSGFYVHRVYLEPNYEQADKDLKLMETTTESKEFFLEDVEVYGDHTIREK